VLGASQALCANALAGNGGRPCLLATAGLVVLVVAGSLGAAIWYRPTRTLRVAALGWRTDDMDLPIEPGDTEWFEKTYVGMVEESARAGARLVACPELTFELSDTKRAEGMRRLSELAQRTGVWLAVGCYDSARNENRMVFIADTGETAGEYIKTHLTPFESFRASNGRPVEVLVDGIPVGGMICQDDNFTDISYMYGRRGVAIVVVPTLDWSQVRQAHLQNTIHRAIETRYAVVRAAADGISAIIAPDGRVVASCDHTHWQVGLIVADVPVCCRRTISSRYGDWFVAACVIYVVTGVVAGRVTELRGR